MKSEQEYVPLNIYADKEKPLTKEIVFNDEFIDCGPSPPAENISFNFDFNIDFSCDNIPKLCQHTIERNLLEHMVKCSGKLQLLQDIENKTIDQNNVYEIFLNTSPAEINIAFLWSAFLQRWELLESFLKLGAQLNYFEPVQGLGALHLASFSGCIAGTQFLLTRGCEVNSRFKFYTPLHCAAFGDSSETALILLNNGARIEELTRSPHHPYENAVHCAVRANATSCVGLFVQEGGDVELLEYCGMSPIHLASDLGFAGCLQSLLEPKGINLNSRSKEKKQTAMHLAAMRGYIDCLEILINRGANPNIKNHMGQTPLHLAALAKSYECVELLLNKATADPNIEDCDKRTAIHAAVGKSGCATNLIELLVLYGARVNVKDQYGYTPLHIAALKGLAQCVETLIYFGADVSVKTKSGMTALNIITKKCPASFTMFMKKLDSAVTLHHPESSNNEVELRLDFRVILQYCHPREINFLNTLVDEGYKKVLKHPLCSALLYLKWKKIKKYYVTRIIFSYIFVLSLSLYVLTALAHNCYNSGKNSNGGNTNVAKTNGSKLKTNITSKLSKDPNQSKEYSIPPSDINETLPLELCEVKSITGSLLRNNPFVIEMQWCFLVGITICEIFRKVYGIPGYHTVRQYFSYPENIIEWAVIASVFVISCMYTGQTYRWQNHVGAFAILLGWTNLMLMIGQLPMFGSYVAMYTRVQSEFVKLLLAYSSLIFGFTLSFCVIFPDSSTFANPFISLVTTLVMMSGELNLDILVDDNPEHYLLDFSAQFVYVIFVLTVTIILMNLLVGIAVDDIKGLQKTARISKLVRQTKLISHMELALFNGNLPTYLLNLFHWTALVSPQRSKVILNLKPLNPKENRLPKDIMKSAFDIAKKNRHLNQSMSITKDTDFLWMNNETDEEHDFTENAALASLMEKIERRNEEIECLTQEILQLKEDFVAGQENIEKLVRALLQSRRGSKC